MSGRSNTETTSSKVASKAAKILNNPNSSLQAKQVAASALTQHPNQNTFTNTEVTSPYIASLAAAILADPHSKKMERSVAGSVLTQSPGKKKSK